MQDNDVDFMIES